MPVSRDQILRHLQEEAGRPLKIRELGRALDVRKDDYGAFRRLVRQMERDGKLVRLRNSRYGPTDRMNLAVGRISITRGGFGFVSREESGSDVFVPAGATGTALNGDRVLVRVTRRGGTLTQPEGEIVRVLERCSRTLVGTYRRRGPFRYVEPDDPRFPRDVTLAHVDDNAVHDGDQVVVTVEDWESPHANPVGVGTFRMQPPRSLIPSPTTT